MKMGRKILGIHIGIASIGWAFVECNDKNKIIKSGVRIFIQAEHPKDGSSLSMPRRLARSTRRTLKRKRQRIKKIKNLLIEHLGLGKEDLFIDIHDKTIYSQKNRIDVWQLRSESLQRKLSKEEFARVLTHIAKRRGYKSNRKIDEEGNSDGKKVLKAIKNNLTLLEHYKTIGQAIYETTLQTHRRRNKKDNYTYSVSREMLLDEVNIIFKKQQAYGNIDAVDSFRQKYIKIAFFQRNFASVDRMVGKCIFEKNVLRAAKRTYSVEEFITLTKLINIKIILEDGSERKFNSKELQQIILLCKQVENPSYIQIQKTIALDENASFKNIGEYETYKTIKFKSAFKGFHILKKVVEKTLSKKHWQTMSKDAHLLDDIGTIFSIYKSDEMIEKALDELSFSMFTIDEVNKIKKALVHSVSFDKFIYLSLKALKKILPYMREGKQYREAIKLAGYKKEEVIQKQFLRALNNEEQRELTNPVIKRAISQTRKVINALIREYGQFDEIHIGLTQELKTSYTDRQKIKKSQEKYRELKKEAIQEFRTLFHREPKGSELLKFRLWKEQDGYCAYSGYMGKEGYIEPEKLIADEKYVTIDHILPYHRSLDDGFNNKVLCLYKENQNKKEMIPFEYFQSIGRDWDTYKEYIWSKINIKKAKRERLLKKSFDEKAENELKEQNTQDASFAARYIQSFIEKNLILKKNVQTINTNLKNMLKYNWNVEDKNKDTYLYHAIDAMVIAFITDKELKKLSTFNKNKAKKTTFIPPMKNFSVAVQKHIDKIFVSHAPRRKITGAAHKETIRSKKSNKIKGDFKVNGGIAEKGEVKRIDVFIKENKYHFVYLYVFDFEKEKLPNITIKNVQIDDTFEFLFSIFKDEFIAFKQKNKEPIRGYMKFALSDGRFAIAQHDDAHFNATNNRFSTGSLEYLKKYQVDVLGNIKEVKREKRVLTKKALKKHKIQRLKEKENL